MRLFLTSAACPRIPGDREASRPYLDEISRSRSASGHYRDSGAARNRSRKLSALHPACRPVGKNFPGPKGESAVHADSSDNTRSGHASARHLTPFNRPSPSNGACPGWLFIRGTCRGFWGLTLVLGGARCALQREQGVG